MSFFRSILIYSLLLFGILIPEAACQQFQNINTEFPLSLSEEIYEDRDGFIWIGTINGLVKYDGYSMHAFRHNPNDPTSLSANNVNAIAQDKTGRIWVGLSRFGFSVLNINQDSFIHPNLIDATGRLMEGTSVNALSAGEDSLMWVGSTHGLFSFSSGDHPEMISSFYYDSLATNSLSSNYILKTHYDSKRRLWVGTARGINLYDQHKGTFTNHRTNPSFPSQQILDIKEDNHGQIWVSTRFTKESLMAFDEATMNFEPVLTNREPYTEEYRFTFDQNNDPWLISRGVGAYHYGMSSGKRTYFDPTNFKDHGYRNIYGLKTLTDRSGNIWITGNSLLKWPATGKAFSAIHTDENTVNSIYANPSSIWYSDIDFKRFDRDSKRTSSVLPPNRPTNIRKTAPEKGPVRIVHCVRDYDDDHIIISTTRSFFKWNTKTNTFKEYPLNVGGPIREFVLSLDKKYLWACANQGSPLLFDLEKGTFHRPSYATSISNVRCVAQDTDGDLWFGSGTAGLFYLNINTKEVQNFAPNHPEYTHRIFEYAINDISVTEEFVWVATNLGLQKINKKTMEVVPLTEPKTLTENSYMSVLEDNDKTLWLGTQQGLIRFDPKNQALSSFSPADGLINDVYTQGACYKDQDGNLYFGGNNGVDYFNPQNIGINTIAPKLYLGKVFVNNNAPDLEKSEDNPTSIDLNHTENFIEIELLALHLTAPKSIHYAYRIPELDTAWRYLDHQRKITLADMQPGKYTLQARAANTDGVWCDDKTLLHINISPPFWATWWFAVLGTSLVLGILSIAYRYHILQVKKRERLKSEFNKRLTELESKALRSQMNPHFLFNSLNSVKSLISQGNNEKATQYLTRFGQLIRQILANSEKPFVRLQEEINALRLYLEIEQLRFQNFTFEIIIDEHVNVDFIEVPPLILQPYVENAIWHGLMHLSSTDRRLTVTVAQDQQFLHLTIEDNGIGRAQAQKIKSLGNARKGGMGMRLTQDRLNLLKTLYGQDVTITVSDLMEKGKPIGTRVDVRIPCLD